MLQDKKHVIDIFFEDIPLLEDENYSIFSTFVDKLQAQLTYEYQKLKDIIILVHKERLKNKHSVPPNRTIMIYSLTECKYGQILLFGEYDSKSICDELYRSIHSFLTNYKNNRNVLYFE